MGKYKTGDCGSDLFAAGGIGGGGIPWCGGLVPAGQPDSDYSIQENCSKEILNDLVRRLL